MAICGRMLEAQGFRVGIIAQPDWSSKDDFMRMVNRICFRCYCWQHRTDNQPLYRQSPFTS
ncbi:hypothetical protein ACLK1S_18665 [Escherichia coli]